MPEEFKKNTIAISWHYSPSDTGFTKYLNYFKSAGFETWVAPGINNWSRIYPNYNWRLENIKQFTRDGQQMGATGQLNTLWYDDGEALAANNWYGILFGCAAAWQQGESSIPQFEANFGPAFHGDMTGKLEHGAAGADGRARFAADLRPRSATAPMVSSGSTRGRRTASSMRRRFVPTRTSCACTPSTRCS